MNKAVLVGRLVASPELKQTPGGADVCSFTVAVNRPGKDKGTDFIDCVAWRGTAKFVCLYFGKGDPIGIEGRIQTRNYEDKNGNKRKAVEVVCDQISFLPGAKDRDKGQEERVDTAPLDDFAEVDDDGDLPFE